MSGRAVSAIGLLVLVGACGGGGGGGGSSLPTGPNVQSVAVSPSAAPFNNVNLLFTTVTICVPGTANCQTIDHVLVDTGSVGVRIMASALSPSLILPQSRDVGSNDPLVTCGRFASGSTWGPVTIADVRMASEIASSVPIQIIGDSTFPTVPAGCPAPRINSVSTLGANGLLGIGLFRQDCGTLCEQSTGPEVYFACVGSTCAEVTTPLNQQVSNPVALFAVNNNGTVVTLPPIGTSGASGATGALAFGIGTQGNNGLGSARVQTVDPDFGTFETVVNGISYTSSFIDSGSNALFFNATFDPSILTCTPTSANPNLGDFYCPPTIKNPVAMNQQHSGGGAAIPVSFQVANASTLNSSFFAFNNLAGPGPGSVFDWGLPFFYGRSIYTAIEGQNTPAGPGPYLAY
ncbi:MAG: DUF3443 domain-containing protein [Betaproteobacteria bacterium]